ncbi:hypothetical protein IPL85_03360 [Candidatus Saccharibacteria bacterium]|nr:MAG: hypothetical protein IPL85_03360 [Candidatus Saccharibacteria bacterium]
MTVITDPGTAAREYAQQARALNQLGDTAHDPDGYALHARGWVQGGGAFVVLTGRIGVGLFHEEYHRLYGAQGQ